MKSEQKSRTRNPGRKRPLLLRRTQSGNRPGKERARRDRSQRARTAQRPQRSPACPVRPLVPERSRAERAANWAALAILQLPQLLLLLLPKRPSPNRTETDRRPVPIRPPGRRGQTTRTGRSGQGDGEGALARGGAGHPGPSWSASGSTWSATDCRTCCSPRATDSLLRTTLFSTLYWFAEFLQII